MRNKKTFFKTLKNYNLFITFKHVILCRAQFYIDNGFLKNNTRKEIIDYLINDFLKTYEGKPITRLLQVIRNHPNNKITKKINKLIL